MTITRTERNVKPPALSLTKGETRVISKAVLRFTFYALLLSLAACASPTPTSLLTPLPPLPTAEVADPTATSEATATSPPPATPVIETTVNVFTPTPGRVLLSPTPNASPTPACTNEAEFVADLTVPDGAQFLPGQTLVKKWSVKNSGSCDWGPGYRLVFISGEPLTGTPGVAAQTEFALYPARANTPAVWEIPMRAPDAPGTYTGRWQARDPQGNFFGAFVFITIEVIPLP